MENFKHKKSFGQNFLKNKKVLMDIIDSVPVQTDDLVIEIGPGQGALTKYLKLYDANLICYELDVRLKKYLNKFEDNKTKIIFNDFLKSDILDDINKIKYNNLYIIANIPYYITTPIIERVINLNLDVQAMVLMVQNEVADRYCAQVGTKDYGFMTVYLNYFYKLKKLFFVDKKCFDPVPKVDSAVILLEKRKTKFEINDEELFLRLVKDSFRMKRKNLKNNLNNYDIDKINKILNDYNLTIQNRAENVPIECFVDMANELSKE